VKTWTWINEKPETHVYGIREQATQTIEAEARVIRQQNGEWQWQAWHQGTEPSRELAQKAAEHDLNDYKQYLDDNKEQP